MKRRAEALLLRWQSLKFSANRRLLCRAGESDPTPRCFELAKELETMENQVQLAPLRLAVSQGLAATRMYLVPAIALWCFGVALMIGYFCVPAVSDSLEAVRLFKGRLGFAFSMASTAIFGGLIPALIAFSFQRQPNRGRQTAREPSATNELSEPPMPSGSAEQANSGVRLTRPSTVVYLVSNILFWAFKGFEIDLFYRFQSWLFGDASTAATVLSKVAVDQLAFAPLWGLTNVILFYLYRDSGFSWKNFQTNLGQRWISRRVLPVLISNWFVWGPACAIVYCLPLDLQLPIQNLILCFWVLILTFFTERPEAGRR